MVATAPLRPSPLPPLAMTTTRCGARPSPASTASSRCASRASCRRELTRHAVPQRPGQVGAVRPHATRTRSRATARSPRSGSTPARCSARPGSRPVGPEPSERAAGKMLYGVSAPWSRRIGNMLRGSEKNTANTSVMIWQDRLYAMVEGARPTAARSRGARADRRVGPRRSAARRVLGAPAPGRRARDDLQLRRRCRAASPSSSPTSCPTSARRASSARCRSAARRCCTTSSPPRIT